MGTNYIVSEQFSNPDHLCQDAIQKAVQRWLSAELTAGQPKSPNQSFFCAIIADRV